jgi:hypothetical protein
MKRFAPSKYMNKKTIIDGFTFDSQAEALRYLHLKQLVALGKITDLILQPEFVLAPKYRVQSSKTKRKFSTISAIKYRADFQYFRGSIKVIEDVKGFRTPIYHLKKRLFLILLGTTDEFLEVTRRNTKTPSFNTITFKSEKSKN